MHCQLHLNHFACCIWTLICTNGTAPRTRVRDMAVVDPRPLDVWNAFGMQGFDASIPVYASVWCKDTRLLKLTATGVATILVCIVAVLKEYLRLKALARGGTTLSTHAQDLCALCFAVLTCASWQSDQRNTSFQNDDAVRIAKRVRDKGAKNGPHERNYTSCTGRHRVIYRH